jgi:hypothetical protein
MASALTATIGYGVAAYDDFFGKASATLKMISSKKTPHALSVAKAQDHDGNEIAETKFGSDTLFDVECTYDLTSGTLDTATLILGKIAEGATGVAPLYECICNGIAVKTSNGAWPQITLKGVMKAAAAPNGISSLFAEVRTWTCPSFTLTGKRSAVLIGLTIADDAEVTASGLTFDAQLSWHTESGTTIAGALTGAELKVTGDAVEITAAPVFSAATPFAAGDIVQKPGRDGKATDYATGSVEATKTYAPDVVV